MPEDGTIHILGRIESIHRDMMVSQRTVENSLSALLEAVNRSTELQENWEARFARSQDRWHQRHQKLEDRISLIEDLSRSHASNWSTVASWLTPVRGIVLAVITAAAIMYFTGWLDL